MLKLEKKKLFGIGIISLNSIIRVVIRIDRFSANISPRYLFSDIFIHI